MDDRTTQAPPRKPSRGVKDMAISLLVLLVPVALVIGFFQWISDGNSPVPVDQSVAISTARDAGLEVDEPAGLGPDWVPVSAVFRTDDGLTLRLGYVTPAGEGVQVVQSTVPAERLLPAELTAGANPGGAIEAGGRTWQVYAGRPEERALVLLEPERTILVVGPATDAELRDLAAALS